ncbi:hypothetical protein AJ79_08867 [Helicocarpus griseus UAMH5409]|uniref:Uncharacterized protein n=1 Tax=Helicocarpus griseus UAMH5409 TaxID=1447875 RepID=A0A2B7WPD2_9EURO|nr:hypothetical protein AJ79_08867 [Helicocarpus griseus UAMH5409]
MSDNFESQCPENLNSTDCLLRLLLTFAFTVPIGIFAALLASVAIYQSILAAVQVVESRFCLRRKDEIRQSDPPAATWLRFLEHTGLQHRIDANFTDVETTVADFLPADLLAVPAYAEVGFIVTMAAAAGAHSFRSVADSQELPYPLIMGDGFQFDFRHHPTLGTIGAFSRSGKGVRESSNHRSIPDRLLSLASAIQTATGMLEESSGWREEAVTVAKSGSSDLPPCLRTTDRDVSFSRTQASLDHPCTSAGDNCLSKFYHQDRHGLFCRMFAKTPLHVPAIFPGTLSRGNPDVLTILALNGRMWPYPTTKCNSGLDMSTYIGLHSKSGSVKRGTALREQVTSYELDSFKAAVEGRTPSHKLAVDRDKSIIIWEELYNLSLEFLHDSHGFLTWLNSLHPLQGQC